jgi:hypothetical protein
MKTQPHTAVAGNPITLEDHFQVQTRIEARAYAIWISSGRRNDTALRDWIKGEDAVLVEYCSRHTRPPARGWASSETRKKAAAGTASKRRPTDIYSQSEESRLLL